MSKNHYKCTMINLSVFQLEQILKRCRIKPSRSVFLETFWLTGTECPQRRNLWLLLSMGLLCVSFSQWRSGCKLSAISNILSKWGKNAQKRKIIYKMVWNLLHFLLGSCLLFLSLCCFSWVEAVSWRWCATSSLLGRRRSLASQRSSWVQFLVNTFLSMSRISFHSVF